MSCLPCKRILESIAGSCQRVSVHDMLNPDERGDAPPIQERSASMEEGFK